jgi:hypothetical protein
LATLILLAVLGPVSLKIVPELLGNLFDQSDYGWQFAGWGTFLVSIGAFLLAYAAVTTLNLTLYYGDDRFPDSREFPLHMDHPILVFVAGTLSAAAFLASVIYRTETDRPAHALAAVLGFLVALAAVFAAKYVQLAATDPKTTPHPPPYLVFPAYKIPLLRRYFDRLYWSPPHRLRGLKEIFNRISQWPLELLRCAGEGYLVDPAAPRGELKLRSGHVFALALAVIAFLFYWGIGIDKHYITDQRARVPALAFVLLFLIVACWALSALTFFFDRYRFPLLWTIAVLAMITANSPPSDHFFRVDEVRDRGTFLTPADYLRERIVNAGNKRVNLVFVATPGGGIQAGAWTAQVLAGLNKEVHDDNSSIPDLFNKSVCFISSVSGGTMGAMIYAASLAGIVPDPAVNARESAIDEVAWGWTQPDFARAVLPWIGDRNVDRGWALEERWIAVNHLGVARTDMWETLTSKGTSGHDIYLRDWAAMRTKLPALVFNSMLVERGQHVVFSTTEYPQVKDSRGVINFYHLYPGKAVDVRIATAARLSASFPYVVPASRPEIDPSAGAFHFVDGGYYDNNGIDSLVGWLADAIRGLDNQIGDILILQIRHFDPAKPKEGSKRGWFFQTYAPLAGLLSMWSAAPASRDNNELGLFLREFNGNPDHKHHAWLTTAQFQGPDDCAPLSWKLSPRERTCITNAWETLSAPKPSVPGGASQNIVPKSLVDCVNAYLNRKEDGPPPQTCDDTP